MKPVHIEHFLLTRFNLGMTDPEWLEHRFALFDQFCYPSVRAQSEQDFRWIIFFDAGTPSRFRERIDGYARWPNIIPVYIESPGKDFARYARDAIRALLPPQTSHIVTTRLDNDDAIHSEFIETIQRTMRPRREALNSPLGYVWHQGRLFLDEQRSNPFVTLVELADDFGTVWQTQHGQIREVAPVRQLGLRPAWVQVVHERNISNRVQGVRVRARNILVEDFHVATLAPVPPETLAGLCISHLRNPVWYGRFVARRFGDLLRGAWIR